MAFVLPDGMPGYPSNDHLDHLYVKTRLDNHLDTRKSFEEPRVNRVKGRTWLGQVPHLP